MREYFAIVTPPAPILAKRIIREHRSVQLFLMLVDLQESNSDVGLALLGRAFPHQPQSVWTNGLERMRVLGENARCGVAYGQMLMDGDAAVGIVLTPACERAMPDGSTRRFVNLSSWYIDPDHRWRAPLMMRSMLKQAGVTFTDLTPTEHVQKILLALGFSPLNDGQVVVPTPLAALRSSDAARAVALTGLPGDAVEPETIKFLEDHENVGCRALVLHADDAWHPLLFKFRSVRGLPVAQLVYCEANAVMRRNVPAICRALLRQGRAALLLDVPRGGFGAGEHVSGVRFPNHGRRFARGAWQTDMTDYAGTELSLFDF